MVYITLSSNGESDPAKFTNIFSEGIMIEPNSYIALVSASVIEDLNHTIITIAANTFVTIRFDPMNLFGAYFPAVDTNYSITGFVDKLNDLFSGLIHTNRRFEAKFVPDAGGGTGQLEFTLYSATTGQTATNWLQHIFPPVGPYANNQEWDSIYPTIPMSAAPPAGWVSGGNTEHRNDWYRWEPVGSLAGTDNASTAEGLFSLAFGAGDYGLDNISNYRTYNIARGLPNGDLSNYSFNDSQFTQLTISNPPGRITTTDDRSWFFTLGNTTNDAAGLNYTDAPLPNQFSYATRPFEIEWKGTGLCDVHAHNITTGVLDIVDADREYFMGDVYRIGNKKNTDTTAPPGNAYQAVVKRYTYDGLVFWIPNSVTTTDATIYPPATAHTYNTRFVYFGTGNSFLYKSIASDPTHMLDNDWISTTTIANANNLAMGCWAGNGANINSYLNNVGAQYQDNALNEAIDITPVPIPGVIFEPWCRDLPLFRRVDTATPEPPTPNSSKRQRLNFNNRSGKIPTSLPTQINFLFQIQDDSIVVNANPETHTLISGTNTAAPTLGPVFQVIEGQTAAHDVVVYDSAGAAVTLTPVDGGATRINIAYNTWYNFDYADDGLGTFRVTIMDIVADVVYVAATALPSLQLREPQSLSGTSDGSATLAADYMYGYIAQYRQFAKPLQALPAGTLNNYWDNNLAGLQTGYRLGDGVNHPIILGQPTEHIMFNPAVTTTYSSLQQLDIDDTLTPWLYCNRHETQDNDNIDDYGAFGDIFFPPMINISHADRIRWWGERAYSDVGCGIVEAAALNADITLENYDAVNERVIEEVRPTFAVGVDNPFFTEPSRVADIDLLDEVFNVEVTNLPHRSFNGKSRTIDKTIYQLPVEVSSKIVHNIKVTEHSPASKVWIPLNNPMTMPLNQLDIQISKEDGKKATLQPDTHLALQIEKRTDIFN